MVAVSSFAFLVFGPLADQRALALAGYELPRRGRRPARRGPKNAWRGSAPREFFDASVVPEPLADCERRRPLLPADAY